MTDQTRGSLSSTEARALALRAQGFGDEWPDHPIEALFRLGALQLDSVSVLARPQEVVPYSRMGAYSTTAMSDAVYRQRHGFEYWGHAASWLPMAEYRYYLPRMAHYRANESFVTYRRDHGPDFEAVLARLRAEGPLTGEAFEDPRPKRRAGHGLGTLGAGGNWWDRKPAKQVLEFLFAGGEVMAAGRTAGFARLYDLPERLLPTGLDTSDPGPFESARHLMKRAVGALGVATAKDAAFYFRLDSPIYRFDGGGWRAALASLEEGGEVVRVQVDGWPVPAYALPAALDTPLAIPEHRPVFLSPFDNLIWNRDRTERLFGFFYRIEIYVPEAKRQFGYYVLPLLANGTLGARADLKLDRATSVLRVRALYLEGASPEDVAVALRDLAAHLDAGRIEVERVEPARALKSINKLVETGAAPTRAARKPRQSVVA